MNSSLGIYFIVIFITHVFTAESSTDYVRDTYLNALQSSHQSSSGGNIGYSYLPPSNNNLQPSNEIYGPPSPVYGPPTIHQPVIYQPRDHWFLEKLKKKINLFTIGKIILKLLIFKKIIKFIGVICLLLFLPKLKHLIKDDMSMEESSGERRSLLTEKDALNKHIDDLQDIILRSIN
ncbi:uncharacterized protein LOC105215769 [Zeugodacus cucurbitae]|uniref:uncharacterized protein LOC105215769 n=1 Tax=Zeugodacus cucurbitae TaxID=28588 RepID=UPI0023D8E5F4|nr:uncharacterized protein LOC105215769 [Zeugodacus cucurbitae]